MKPINLLAAAAVASAMGLVPTAQAQSWSDLAAATVKQAEHDKHRRHDQRRDNRHDRRKDRRDFRADRRQDRRDHRHFDRQHRNVRRAMRQHGISRFDQAYWTGNSFRVSGFTAHGLIDIVFGYPNYSVHSVAHRRHHARDRHWGHNGYRDSYRPHYNRRPLKERRVRRIAARQYGLDVFRARCVDGRWILVGHRHGYRGGRYKLVLDAFSGHQLAFHRVRGHR